MEHNSNNSSSHTNKRINWFDTPVQNSKAQDNFINQDIEEVEEIKGNDFWDKVGQINGVDSDEYRNNEESR